MSRRRVSRVMGVVLSVATLVASVAGQARAALAPAASEVVVDATEVGTLSTRKVEEVAAKATQAVVDAGLPPSAVRVTFVEVDLVSAQRGVRVVLATAQAPVVDPDGDPRGRLLASCTACSDAELAGLAIEAVLEAIDQHEDALQAEREAAEAAAAAPAPAPEPEPEPAAPPPTPSRPRRGLGPLGWSGVAALGLGVGAVVTGSVLATREPTLHPDQPREDQLRDVRPPGYAVLGVGAALVATGVALLVVDRRRARRTMAAAPWLGPGSAGLAAAVRF